jgi:hypothetical protein
MTSGIFALIFLIMSIIIIVLGFQVNDNINKSKDVKIKLQDKVTEAARLILQSSTQNHPLFALEFAMKAKIYINEVVESQGSVYNAEKVLKYNRGRLDNLKNQIESQYETLENLIMEEVISRYPQLETDINESAGLRKLRKRAKASTN